jgi:cytochrome c-type biogenesis protein CcmH
MIRRRTLLRRLVSLPAAALAAAVLPAVALAQAPPDGMAQGGGVILRSEAEHPYFAGLLCMCGGCQREALDKCACGVADDYRNQVRAMMAKGLTQEEIKAEWARRYGPQALAVPPNSGANRLLYLAPLALIAVMGAFAVMLLRRFRHESDEKVGAVAPSVADARRDEYDEKLDEELKQLDHE